MSYDKKDNIPPNHPRYESLKLRARMVEAYNAGLLADSGLIAHGRGEAFDYLLGEKTTSMAKKAIEAAAAYLLLAQNPVISVNGNTAALIPQEIVELAGVIGAKLEINLFYRTPDRVKAIYKVLKDVGAEEVLGLEENPENIPGLRSPRSRASKEGVYKADVVLVPLEDGDRAEALVSNGKKVLTVDLNPLSRTSKTATVTIVDNLVRVIPYLEKEVIRLKKVDKSQLQEIVDSFQNQENLQDTLKMMIQTYIGQ
ncbi:MAG: phosphopantothenate/pantothenate synthetase [Methanobacterium sp.]|nr:phosphopantothenate/pantothenate synthetase [Methanobacterium sp.]